MKYTHEVREPWRANLQSCQVSIGRLEEQIRAHKASIHDSEIELQRVRAYTNDTVFLLAAEAEMPKGAVYSLSPDGTQITCNGPDPQKEPE